MDIGVGQADGDRTSERGNTIYSSVYQFPCSLFTHACICSLNKYLLRAHTDKISAFMQLLLSNKAQSHDIAQLILRNQ